MGIVDRYREVLSSTIAYSLFLLHSALSVSGLQFPSITCRVIEACDVFPVPCFDIHGAPERPRDSTCSIDTARAFTGVASCLVILHR